MKEKEIWDQIVAERSNEINTSNKLTYHFKSENRTPIRFNYFNYPLGRIRKIKHSSIDLEKVKENQGKIKSNLNETIRGK